MVIVMTLRVTRVLCQYIVEEIDILTPIDFDSLSWLVLSNRDVLPI